MEFYAHSHPDLPPRQWHRLEEHLREVGRRAAEFAAPFDSSAWAKAAGEWHDVGKYAPEFQKKLMQESGPDAHIEDVTLRVDHSTAGALLAQEILGSKEAPPLAWVIAGHHAGLDDMHSLFQGRLASKRDCLERARRGAIPAWLEQRPELKAPAFLRGRPRGTEFWIRMLFSALTDADFLDTESWFGRVDKGTEERVKARAAETPGLQVLRERLDRYLKRLSQGKRGEVQELRSRVLDACVRAGRDKGLPPGHFSLTVPTGGGKTLSALAFALDHALTHGLRRVITVIPFTNIIEQTADAYRGALAPMEGTHTVVEHHSALLPDDPSRENSRTRVAAENWDAPIIVTTAVQFLESLFANRPGRCRKLHNICESVVILDEVQTLPRQYLDPILDALNELQRNYRVSVVLCTATQPALGRSEHLPGGLENIQEIVPEQERLSNFDLSRRRVRVQWPEDLDQPTTWEDLATRIAQEKQALAVVHLRDDARALTSTLDRALGNTDTIHLSALLYPEHRRRVLMRIRKALERGEECRVVATQIVEAGVDLDFPIVFRALAGADSLVQAAGRCNREGRLPGGGRFVVFVAPTQPPLGVLSQGLREMRALLEEAPDRDLFDPDLYPRYFQALYRRGATDGRNIQGLRESFQFRELAEAFRLIPDVASPVVVPFPAEGVDVEPCGRSLQALRQGRADREIMRRLQSYSVSAYPKMLRDLDSRGGLELLPSEDRPIVRALYSREEYDPRFGLGGGSMVLGPLIA